MKPKTELKGERIMNDNDFSAFIRDKLPGEIGKIIDEELEKSEDEIDTELIEYCLELTEKKNDRNFEAESRTAKHRIRRGAVIALAAVLFLIGAISVSAAVFDILPYEKYFSEKIEFTDDKGREYFVSSDLPDIAIVSGEHIKNTYEWDAPDKETRKIKDNRLYRFDYDNHCFYIFSKEKIRIDKNAPAALSSYYEGGYKVTKDGVYCVNQKGEFLKIDYSGKSIKLLASREYTTADFIVYEEVAFVLTDRGEIFRIYIPERKAELVYEGINMEHFKSFIDIYSNYELGWLEENPLFWETAYKNGFPESEKEKITFDEYSENYDCFDFNIGMNVLHYINTQTGEHKTREQTFIRNPGRNAARKWWLMNDELLKAYDIFSEIDFGGDYSFVTEPEVGDFGGVDIYHRLQTDSFGKQGELQLRLDLGCEYDGEKLISVSFPDPYFSFGGFEKTENRNGISVSLGRCKYKAFDYSEIITQSYVAVWSDRQTGISFIFVMNANGFREDGKIIGSEISFDEFSKLAESIPINKNNF